MTEAYISAIMELKINDKFSRITWRCDEDDDDDDDDDGDDDYDDDDFSRGGAGAAGWRSPDVGRGGALVRGWGGPNALYRPAGGCTALLEPAMELVLCHSIIVLKPARELVPC